jgi:enoyl-CoA hydratase
MGEYENILVDRVGSNDRVARITLNRPERLNAIDTVTAGELFAALRTLEADHEARVIIIRGAGRAFCTGHDLASPAGPASPFDPGARFRLQDDRGRTMSMNFSTFLRQVTDVQMYLWSIAKVTIVQAHGYCIAGGMEFAMMADLVTASEDCKFGHPGHRGLGVARNGMILPLVIGMRKAKELFYTGDAVSGVEAERLGLINYAWPAEELEARTIALADRIANQSSDMLAALKAGANRFYEEMGIHSAVSALTALDGIVQGTESAYQWRDQIASGGLKNALAWRDGPYHDYGAAKPSADERQAPAAILNAETTGER